MASVDTGDSGSEKRGQGHKQKKWMARKRIGFFIDMTPYVDVIMLLLTFFIMTTTLNQPQVMQINLPKGDKEEVVKVDMATLCSSVFLKKEISGSRKVNQTEPKTSLLR
jgi:biopolymer transport protein ExbD